MTYIPKKPKDKKNKESLELFHKVNIKAKKPLNRNLISAKLLSFGRQKPLPVNISEVLFQDCERIHAQSLKDHCKNHGSCPTHLKSVPFSNLFI